MRHTKHITLTLLAVFLITAITATTATANPTILPTPTAGAPLNFSATGGAGELLNAAKNIKCKKFKATGSFTSSEKGQITDIDFEECESNGTKCNTKGDKAGIVLVKNSDITVVDYKNAAKELLLGLVISPLLLVEEKEKDIVILCAAETAELTILGSVMGAVEGVKTLVKTKTAKLNFAQEKDDNVLLECSELPEFCAKGPFDLKAKFTAKEAESLGALLQTAEITFEKEAEIHF